MNKLPKRLKNWVWVIVGLIVALGFLFIALIIFFIIWLAGVIQSSDTTTQVIDTAKQQVTETQVPDLNTNPLDYIQNGEVNTTKLQQYVESLSPDQLLVFVPEFRQEMNQLLESGKLLQEQANALLQLLP